MKVTEHHGLGAFVTGSRLQPGLPALTSWKLNPF
ncbi:hypothetical protein GQ600_12099 [Phytophthora cactorum]|nr:hypothetical protein GQ600_12099 [Phytophthora cactorum]